MIGSRLDFMIFLCIFPVSKSWKDTYHGDLNEMLPTPPIVRCLVHGFGESLVEGVCQKGWAIFEVS